jgi:hypothetical protein
MTCLLGGAATSSGIGYGLAAGETRVSALLPNGVAQVRVKTRDGA